MAKTLLELAGKMIASQVSSASLTAEEMAEALEKVYEKLKHLQKLAEAPQEEPTVRAAVPPSRSIQRNKVICLECGQEFRQLTERHLALHETTPREYRLKWGFPTTLPLACKALVEKRSETAKRLRVVEKALEARRKDAAGARSQATAKAVAPKRAGTPQETRSRSIARVGIQAKARCKARAGRSKPVHVTSKATATEIRRSLGISARDLKAALKAVDALKKA